ncbi:MAG: permease [Treponema sp.]|nr:permease [Treponema sp.]
MLETIIRELIYIWYYFSVQLQQIVGYWLIGMAVGSLVAVFGKEKIHQCFAALRGKRLGIIGIIPASLLGIASPLCMYGTIPIAASFANEGMEEDVDFQSAIAAFMMSSILLNPQLLLYSAALGPAALIIRFSLCLLCGITAGIVIRFCFRQKSFFNFSGFTAPQNHDTDSNLLLRFIKNFGRNVRATGLYFLAGIILSALFQRYVPPAAFAKLFGGAASHGGSASQGFGVLMAATIGVPLYVCGGGTIPLLQSWIHRGMSMGAAAAFMLAGPAMKITNLGALKIVLGLKHFVLYILFAIVFSVLSGLAINLFLIPHP